MNPFSIAVGGLRPGAPSLEIASEGLLTITITPPPEEDQDGSGGFVFTPMRWTPARTRQDCRIEVTGCRATLTATKENIAKNNFTIEDEDRLDDYIFAAEFDARIDAEEEERKQRDYVIRFDQVSRRWQEHQAAKAERKFFRQAVESLAKQLRDHADSAEDVAAMIVGLSQQNTQMLERLEEMEERLAQAEKPAPAKAKPAKGRK